MNPCKKNLGPLVEVYQFRIRLVAISPMIWRRILIRSDSTIADLHFCIQIAFGWSDTYLNQFTIHGKSYGVYHDGGISFCDNPRKIYLKNFKFRIKEKFVYEYNFFEHWEHEIRLEKLLSVDSKKIYPLCIGGNRAAPLEDCGGPTAFMELDDYYSPWRIEEKLLECLESYQAGDEDIIYVQDTVQMLKYWILRYQFNRRALNRQLRRYANGDDVDDIIVEG